MRILSFDQATGTTGWATGSTTDDPRGSYEFGSIKTPKRDQFGERLAIVFDIGAKLIEKYKPDMIYYEEPYQPPPVVRGSFGKPKSGFIPAEGFLPAEIHAEGAQRGNQVNMDTLNKLQMVKGCIITLAALYGIPTEGTTPAHWRKTLLGMGRIPDGVPAAERDKWFKRAVRDHFSRLGYETKSDDESDALGILYHGLFGPEAAQRAQGDLLGMVKRKL